MKEVYIVADESYVYGVFRTKKEAIFEKKAIRFYERAARVHIKKRFNKHGYKIGGFYCYTQ